MSSSSTPEGPGSESSSPDAQHGLSRRTVIGVAAAAVAASVGSSWMRRVAASGRMSTWTGRASVSQERNLPAGFFDAFRSKFVEARGVRIHVVTGGNGPPLLLAHGWPETWYAWRLLMPALARDFRVVAVDLRGYGRSEKPEDGYDTGTLAQDLVETMDALGHRRFAMVGHDVGMETSYALAADHPHRVVRLAVAEGVLPGVAPSPPLFLPEPINDRLWHIAFNRVDKVNEQLVRGREDIFFGYEFATGAVRKFPPDVVRHYVNILTDPANLRGSFGFYRALDITTAQNQQRVKKRLTIPVLAIGGQYSGGEGVADTMRLAADNVQSLVIPDCGHFVAEEAPKEMLAALSAFLGPYRVGEAAVHDPARSAAATG